MEIYYEVVEMNDLNFKLICFESSAREHAVEVHPHWHNEVEVLYFVDGNARQQVNDHFFIAEPGDIVIINKNQLHSTFYTGTGKCNIIVLMFDAENVLDKNLDNNEHSAAYYFDNFIVYKNPINMKLPPGRLLYESIANIHKEISHKNPSYKFMVKADLYKITGALSRFNLFEIRNRDENSLKKSRHMLKNTFKLIDDCYNENISLKRASESSYLSVPHFCRLFKDTTGMSFNEYLTFYRINRAERLLETNKTIAELSLECGFGSISSFIRSFKKYKHCTPLVYRKSNLK